MGRYFLCHHFFS